VYFLDFLRQLNWVDLFIAILLIRIGYISIKTGFPIELFKFLGTISSIYFSCHYYLHLSSFFRAHGPLKAENWQNLLDFTAFLLLVLLGYLIFFILRKIFGLLIKVEAVSLLNCWGALMLGVIRWALFASLLLFLASFFNNSYLRSSMKNSILSPRLIKLTPATYGGLWNSIMFRFMDEKTFNKAVYRQGNQPSLNQAPLK